MVGVIVFFDKRLQDFFSLSIVHEKEIKEFFLNNSM
jgi:hypothetical protein